VPIGLRASLGDACALIEHLALDCTCKDACSARTASHARLASSASLLQLGIGQLDQTVSAGLRHWAHQHALDTTSAAAAIQRWSRGTSVPVHAHVAAGRHA